MLAWAFVLTAALTLVADPAAGAEGDESLCAGAVPTKSGTSGGDRLNGTLFNDVIFGLAGDDTISGGGLGNDLLCGDADNDRLTGGLGHDRMVGGEGDDNLAGAFGNDRLVGGKGDDTLGGADGSDVLAGGADDDALNGGNGKDYLIGDSGTDTLVGGSGDDTIETFDGEADAIDCGPGADVVTADSRDLINSNCENVTKRGPSFEITPNRWRYGLNASSHVFTIKNAGDPWTPKVGLSREFFGDSGHFTIEATTCTNVVLPRGASCAVEVKFTPSAGNPPACVSLSTYDQISPTGVPPTQAYLSGGPHADPFGQPYCPFT